MEGLLICYEKCGTCQKAKKWLDGQGIAYVERPIRTQPPTEAELSEWIPRSGLPLKRWWNTTGQSYRALGLKDRLPQMDETEQKKLLASDGMLVKRPILVLKDRVLVGFRPEEWAEALQKETEE